MGLMINPAPTFTLNNGDIASEGKLHFFENGSTSIRKPVYIDPELNNQLNNPLTLTDAGRLPTCFGTGTYTIVLESSAGIQQWVRNDVAIDDLSGQFSDYSSVKIYLANEIVRYTDGNYYFSQKNNNRGNAPSSDSEWWSQIGFLEFFNTSKAADADYMLNNIVIYNGFIYRSLEDNNGDTPPSAKWANLTFNDSVAGNFSVGGDLSVTGAVDGLSFGGPSSGNAKFPSGEIQVGPDAGPKLLINSSGEVSSDGLSYLPLATSDSLRVTGALTIAAEFVIDKKGSTVTITSAGSISHASSVSASTGAIIPARFRPSAVYGGNGVRTSVIYNGLASVSVDPGGSIVIDYYNFDGTSRSSTGVPSGITISYLVADEII